MNLLPGTMLGTEGPWARVRIAGGAEVLADAGAARLYPGAAVVVALRPADLRIVDAATAALRGNVEAIGRADHVRQPALVRVDVAGSDGADRVATVECVPNGPLPAPGASVGLAFDPACGRVSAAPGRPAMRRGPDGPYLADRRRL